MKRLWLYYGSIVTLLLIIQWNPWGPRFFPGPKINTLNFPSKDQIFTPELPVLSPGLEPHFPASEIIFQEQLFAPFVILKDQNLSKKNLSKAHLSFADLRNTNLQGTNLSQALLYGARLEGAWFDEETKLPFSKETALALGMKERR